MATTAAMAAHNARVTREFIATVGEQSKRVRGRTRAALIAAGAEITAFAKEKGPWVDQTGETRRGIGWQDGVTPEGAVLAIYAGGTAPYDIHLEQYGSHHKIAANVVNRRLRPKGKGAKTSSGIETNRRRVERINALILSLEFKSSYWIISGAVKFYEKAVVPLIQKYASAEGIVAKTGTGFGG